mmetsp:Transcript_50316/g.75187  ORF Transcript_50316/g.75187 Transcript_50316/m.75187 type:complete len:208 (-) Transcript_50316:101-724(-)
MYSTEDSSMAALVTLIARIRERNETIDALRLKQDDIVREGVDGVEEAADQLIDSLLEREQILDDAKRLHQSIICKLDPQQDGDTETHTGDATSASQDQDHIVYEDHESCNDEQTIEILGMSLLDLEENGPFGQRDIDNECFDDFTVDSIGLTKGRLETHMEETIHKSVSKPSTAAAILDVKNLPQPSYAANIPMIQRVNTAGRNCAA